MSTLVADIIWAAVVWYAVRDVLLIGERVRQWIDHRAECERWHVRAERRAQHRYQSSRAPALPSVSPAPPGARRRTPVDTAVAPRSAVSTGPIPRSRADATLPFTSGASPARPWAGSEDTPAHLTRHG